MTWHAAVPMLLKDVHEVAEGDHPLGPIQQLET